MLYPQCCSATATVNALPTAYTVTGGGSFCPGGSGVSVGLASSSIGVNYQLYVGSTPVGSAVAGTSGAISFGLQTTLGTYTVVPTNGTTGCIATMTGSATVANYTLPTAFALTERGRHRRLHLACRQPVRFDPCDKGLHPNRS